MSDDINPYAPPSAEIPLAPADPLKTTTLLARGWKLYRANFLLITIIVTIVWLPCDILSSYMDNFVFSEDEYMRSMKFSQFLENFFGIIATAGVLSIALQKTSGGTASLGQALGAGFTLWPKMWWTGFLSGLVLIFFLLLVVPFFIIFPRLLLTESVVVAEHESGTSAIRRSYDLSRGCYWPLFRLIIVVSLIVFLAATALVSIPDLIPGLDHWLVDAVFYVLSDIAAAYEAVVLYCAYQACLLRQNMTGPA